MITIEERLKMLETLIGKYGLQAVTEHLNLSKLYVERIRAGIIKKAPRYVSLVRADMELSKNG